MLRRTRPVSFLAVAYIIISAMVGQRLRKF